MAWSTPPLACTVNEVEITVLDVGDELGRTVVEHRYPGVNGVDLEDGGGEPLRININGYITGPRWLDRVSLLRQTITWAGADTLVHPQYGSVTGKVRSLQIAHSEAEHDTARVRLQFVEGRTTAAAFDVTSDPSAASAAVLAAADEVTAAAAGLSS